MKESFDLIKSFINPFIPPNFPISFDRFPVIQLKGIKFDSSNTVVPLGSTVRLTNDAVRKDQTEGLDKVRPNYAMLE